MALCVLQRDAEDLRAQLRAARADMTAAAQRAEAEHRESLCKLRQVQSEADAQACSNLLTLIQPLHTARSVTTALTRTQCLSQMRPSAYICKRPCAGDRGEEASQQGP